MKPRYKISQEKDTSGEDIFCVYERNNWLKRFLEFRSKWSYLFAYRNYDDSVNYIKSTTKPPIFNETYFDENGNELK